MTKLVTIVVGNAPAIETVMVTVRKEKQDRMKKTLGFSHKAVFSQVLRNNLFSLEKPVVSRITIPFKRYIFILLQNYSVFSQKMCCIPTRNVLSLEKMGVLSQNESIQLRIFEFSRKTISFNGENLCSLAIHLRCLSKLE